MDQTLPDRKIGQVWTTRDGYSEWQIVGANSRGRWLIECLNSDEGTTSYPDAWFESGGWVYLRDEELSPVVVKRCPTCYQVMGAFPREEPIPEVCKKCDLPDPYEDLEPDYDPDA